MRQAFKRIRGKAGYTLTEMMMVVGIMGVTASTAGFQWVRNRPQQDLNRASWEIVSILREARSEAARQGVPTVVTVNQNQRRITIWTDTNGNGVRNDGEERHLNLATIPNISIWCHPTGGTFSSLGTFTPVSSGSWKFMMLNVTSSTAGRTTYLRVYPNGQVHLVDQ